MWQAAVAASNTEALVQQLEELMVNKDMQGIQDFLAQHGSHTATSELVGTTPPKPKEPKTAAELAVLPSKVPIPDEDDLETLD